MDRFTCTCTPAIRIAETGRYILPQHHAIASEQLAASLPVGVYPPVRFGRDGVSINAIMLADDDMAALADLIPDGSKKPLGGYYVGDMNTMELKVHWPGHYDRRTQVAETLPLCALARVAGVTKPVPYTKAQIAANVAKVVVTAMTHCLHHRPHGHGCWSVSADQTRGLTWSSVYLVAIHHRGGDTYQPELHVALSLRPPLFPEPNVRAIQGAPTACSCARALKDEESGMYVLPQRPATMKRFMGETWPAGTFPSIFFGQSGPLSIETLTRYSADQLKRVLPNSLDKPFEDCYKDWKLTRIKVKVHWPDHDDKETHVSHDVPLADHDGSHHINTIQLAMEVASTVRAAIHNCNIYRPQRHCCWAIAPTDRYGLTKRCIYLVALHHVGGITYQPELHVAPSVPPYQFPPPFPVPPEEVLVYQAGPWVEVGRGAGSSRVLDPKLGVQSLSRPKNDRATTSISGAPAP
ncbi:uncharacterized protein C8Q71DRAFT_547845 [Rhodofomes roseus]|uniref:Uncharacterized protein n=1 Tax=Rhodofomes roseus TaxID=34475 RepID=A0ABQ8KHW5_9APHY|nr:uncharacterized protein C8Q71DRAFT_547845 [Rhodofomes roseus]KAH9837543.1 hypothetical protein C8Q71DRAFT_547845 [Rhodofomes roseus]